METSTIMLVLNSIHDLLETKNHKKIIIIIKSIKKTCQMTKREKRVKRQDLGNELEPNFLNKKPSNIVFQY